MSDCRYDEASVAVKELLEHEVQNPSGLGRRYVLYVVLLNLKRNDFVEAKLACGMGEKCVN